jgi:hypothetical protein
VGNGGGDRLVLSYLSLRQAVGVLGVALPIVLLVGAGWRPSISDYYGSGMRDVFVGVLFAIAVFLYSYVGYEEWPDKKPYQPLDNTASTMACIFALGVALFPVTSESDLVRIVHLLAAAALFLTLAYFSLFLFTKTKETGTPRPEKRARNRVYVVCGVVMLACIGLIAVYSLFLQGTGIGDLRPVFWLETLALWAFGVSWFVKGEGLKPLNDGGRSARSRKARTRERRGIGPM